MLNYRVKLLGSVITCVLIGCGKAHTERVTYQSIDGNHAITIVSSEELELREGSTTLLCKYTKQDEKLRIVETVNGTNQVLYFRFTNQGLEND